MDTEQHLYYVSHIKATRSETTEDSYRIIHSIEDGVRCPLCKKQNLIFQATPGKN